MLKAPLSKDTIVYFQYIPYENLLSDDLLLIEESGGLYIQLKPDFPDDVLYQFTLKPVKKIQYPLKQKIQYLVYHLKFPIITKTKKWITIYDLAQTYKGKSLTFQYDLEKEKFTIEGPLF